MTIEVNRNYYFGEYVRRVFFSDWIPSNVSYSENIEVELPEYVNVSFSDIGDMILTINGYQYYINEVIFPDKYDNPVLMFLDGLYDNEIKLNYRIKKSQ